MDYKFWLDTAQTLLIAGVGIMNWLNNRQRITTATINKLEDSIDARLDNQTMRLTRVEQDLKHAPKQSDFNEVNRRLTLLNGEMKELKGELHGVHTTLNLIHKHLLDKNKAS